MVKEEAYRPKRQHNPTPKKRLFSPSTLIAIFFGLIMMTSTIGFIASYTSDGSDTVTYNGFKFVRTNQGYSVVVNEQELLFGALPDSLTNILLDDQIVDRIRDAESVTLTYDPQSQINTTGGLIEYELENVLGQVLDIYVQRAVINNTPFPSLLQADCSQATVYVPVISWELGNESAFKLEGDCIRAIARSDIDALRLSERLSYRLLGVMSS
ncbi:MAG TPA: hypothetical protein VJH22_01735 [Candidatus Nanoarchaeia archaeon]|nr:hypothetical protein [Candidatus Nanoarchaeia archaeon]